MSWFRAHSRTCNQIFHVLLPEVDVWQLLFCLCGVPCLTRGRVCSLPCNHSMVRVAQNLQPYYTLSFETPPNLEGQVAQLYQVIILRALTAMEFNLDEFKLGQLRENLELGLHHSICLKTAENDGNLCRHGRSNGHPHAHPLLVSSLANRRTWETR
jgi:hypothetical protein